MAGITDEEEVQVVKSARKQLPITSFFASQPPAEQESLTESHRKRQRIDAPAQADHPDLHAAQGASGCCLLLNTPATWQQALVREYLTPKERSAWYKTCRTGRAQVMTYTPHLKLQMTLDDRKPDRQLLQRSAQQLQRFHATLHTFEADRDEDLAPDPGYFSNLLRLLSATPPQHLRLCTLPTTHNLYSAITATCPSLQGLHLDTIITQLPPPSQLPALTHLGVTVQHTDRVLPSMLSYLTQLTSLELGFAWARRAEQLPTLTRVLTSATTLPLLLKLSMPDSTLCDSILGLLLEHTPALQHLEVSTTELGQSRASCMWQLRHFKEHNPYPRALLSQLLCMPSPAEGRVTTVELGRRVNLPVEAGVLVHTAKLLARLKQLHLSGIEHWEVMECDPPYIASEVASFVQLASAATPRPKKVSLTHVPVSAATISALAQLSNDCEVQLNKAVWNVHPAVTLDELPCVQGCVSITLPECDADDRVLSVLLHCAPQLQWLSVRALSLASDTNSGAVWAMVTLTVKGAPVALSSVARLPDHKEKGCWLDVSSEGLVCDVTDPQVIDKVRSKVGSIRNIFHVALRPAPTMPATEQPTTLQLASTLHISVHGCRHSTFSSAAHYDKPTVRLTGWALTAGLLEVLAGLPGRFLLSLCESDWQLSLSELETLMSHLPTKCGVLSITPRPSHQQLSAMIGGAAARGRHVLLTLPFEWGLKNVLPGMREASGLTQKQLSFRLEGGWAGSNLSHADELKTF